MELLLKRVQMESDVSIGMLYVGDEFECYTCEDAVRLEKGEPKIKGQTAIPVGRYEVFVTMSTRFNRLLPLLVGVPQFEGIRIHPGNTAADTEGCILPGVVRLDKGVGQSRIAFEKLYEKIYTVKSRMGPVYITVINDDVDPS